MAGLRRTCGHAWAGPQHALRVQNLDAVDAKLGKACSKMQVEARASQRPRSSSLDVADTKQTGHTCKLACAKEGASKGAETKASG